MSIVGIVLPQMFMCVMMVGLVCEGLINHLVNNKCGLT